MKKLLFCAMILGLAGCNASIGDSISASNIVWVNQSDHIIRLVASVGGYSGGVDETLQKGDTCCYYKSNELIAPILPREIQQLKVIFDQTEIVLYTREDSFLKPPTDYPAEYDLINGDLYTKIVRKGWVTQFVYTLTNADYEAAKAWSESQQ